MCSVNFPTCSFRINFEQCLGPFTETCHFFQSVYTVFLFMNYNIFSKAHEILGLSFKAATQRVHNFPTNVLSRKSLRTAILPSWIIKHCRTTAYSSSGTYTKVQMSPEIQVKHIRYYQETRPLWCPLDFSNIEHVSDC